MTKRHFVQVNYSAITRHGTNPIRHVNKSLILKADPAHGAPVADPPGIKPGRS